jgi:hypothetical protein
MTYETLVEELLRNIPEVKPMYDKEIEWWDGNGPGPHNIFGDVLNPYLINLLKQDEDIILLKKIFHLLESMAKSEDVLVQEVLECTILERLGDDRIILEKARKYMGKASQKMSNDIEKGLGRE